MGVDIYAWGDNGLHPETFWLGYAVAAAAAWRPGSPDPHELTQSFYRLFYGSGSTDLGRIYRLMSTQAQFWSSSWDSEPSGKLPLVFGYSYGIGPFTPHAATLPTEIRFLSPSLRSARIPAIPPWRDGTSQRS